MKSKSFVHKMLSLAICFSLVFSNVSMAYALEHKNTSDAQVFIENQFLASSSMIKWVKNQIDSVVNAIKWDLALDHVPATVKIPLQAAKKTDRVHNIAINGAGRIGRLLVREIVEENNPNLNIRAIVGAKTSQLKTIADKIDLQFKYARNIAKLLNNDSAHRKWKGFEAKVIVENSTVYIVINDDYKIEVVDREDNPANLPWKKMKIDILAEASGTQKTPSKAKAHIKAGAKRVVIGAPGSKDEDGTKIDGTYVFNVNTEKFDASQTIISNASCTTNCAAPVLDTLKQFGIEGGSIVTTHAVTGSQSTLDKVSVKSPAKAKGSNDNIINTTSGVAKALPEVDPSLKGKFTAKALRVPTNNVSLNSIIIKLNKTVTKEEIIKALEQDQNNGKKGTLILKEIKSSRRLMSERVTSVVVPSSITVKEDPDGGTIIGLDVWYDNEAGYTDQYIRFMEHVAMVDEGKEFPKVEKDETDYNPEAKELKPEKSVEELAKEVEVTNERVEYTPIKPVNIALNGAGRISLAALRQLVGDARFNLKAIAYDDIASLVDRYKWDTAHGREFSDVEIFENYITINGKKIDIVERQKDPKDLPWKDYDIDIVIDTTGKFKKESELQGHIKAGAKKVVLSVPFADKDEKIIKDTYVVGVNDDKYEGADVASAASCTTNAYAPAVKLLNGLASIIAGRFVTVHSVTASQAVLDKRAAKEERGDASKQSILTSTGAAKTTGLVLPELFGKLDGNSVRVDTIDGSVIETSIVVDGELTPDQINKEFLRASMNEMKGIVEVRDFVEASSDIIGERATTILSAKDTTVITLPNGQSMVKLTIFYDNEFGYTNQMMNLAGVVAEDLQKDIKRTNEPLIVDGVGEIPTIASVEVKDQRVVDRVDFNVPVDVEFDENNNVIDSSIKITDANRIKKELPTILKLLESGSKYITLVTHFEPKLKIPGEKDRKIGLSTRVIAEKLKELLPEYADKIEFLAGSVDADGLTITSEDLDKKAKENGTKLFITENIRFAKSEKKGDIKLREQLTSLADVYVNDAFAAFHREHSSMMPLGTSKNVVGDLVRYEVKNLSKAFRPKRPMVAIFGGSKVEDKVDVIDNFLETMKEGDTVLISGAMAYTFLAAINPDLNLGNSMLQKDKINLAKSILAKFDAKGIQYKLPIDHVITKELNKDAKKDSIITTDQNVGDGFMAVDIGPETAKMYAEILDGAKTVVWNGPAGVFEEKFGGFIDGFTVLAKKAKEIADNGADIIIGGGDTGKAFKETGVDGSKIFISTAGGASFAFLTTKGNMGVMRNLSLSIPSTTYRPAQAAVKTKREHNVVVNGAGRIGRLLIREMVEENNPNLKIKAVVGAKTSQLAKEEDRLKLQYAYAKNIANLLNRDSAHGKWRYNHATTTQENGKTYIVINDTYKILVVGREDDPANYPWKEMKIDILAEASGTQKSRSKAKGHIDAGAKRVVIGAPGAIDDNGDNIDGTYVYNVNEKLFDASQKIISNASCTTNCAAPVITTLKKFGIQSGTIVTTHAVTGSQSTLDRVNIKDPAKAKAAFENIIKSTSGVSKALPIVDPELAGKFTASSLRVPASNVSVNSLVIKFKDNVTVEDIKAALLEAQEKTMKGTLKLEEIKVGGMMMSERVTSVVIPSSITAISSEDGGTLVGMHVWYDNEAGYTDQYIRMMEHVAMVDEGQTFEEEEKKEKQIKDANPSAKELKPTKMLSSLAAAQEVAKPRKAPVVDGALNVALNGGGRISLAVLRQIIGDERINLKAVAYHDIKSLFRRLQDDSVHGKIEADLQLGEDFIVINGKRIDIVSTAKDAEHLKDLPWGDYDIDVVIDATGVFKKESELKGHIDAGAKKVVLSVPFGDNDDDIQFKSFVYGVNSDNYTGQDILSAASCTTNAFAPGASVINSIGKIISGKFTTVHAVTGSQSVIDKKSKKPERGRSKKNPIYTTTGAAKTTEYIIPELKGKISGDCFRVDVLDGSVIEFTALIEGDVTSDQVNNEFLRASRNELNGVIKVQEKVDASTEIVGERETTIFSAQDTVVIQNGDGTSTVKVTMWYDNEYGYTNQMLNLAVIAGLDTRTQNIDELKLKPAKIIANAA